MAESLLLDLDDGSVTLDDVRQRVDEMLAVLLQLEEELMGRRGSLNSVGGELGLNAITAIPVASIIPRSNGLKRRS